MENEIVPAQEIAMSSVMILSDKLSKGEITAEQLETILKVQMQHESNEARKAYARSFAKVQASIENVIKTKHNKQTHSNYAELADVVNLAKPAYTEAGFSVIFYEGESSIDGHMRICADVLHVEGHMQTYHYDIPLDGVGIKGNANMTKIHGKASSVSYGRRYLLCMIWNIPTVENDGNQDPVDNYKAPTGNKKEAVNKVFDLLLDSAPDGKRIDLEKLSRYMFNTWKNYPSNEAEAKKTAAVIADGYINLVCVDKKGQ